jgi:hypothetical protein
MTVQAKEHLIYCGKEFDISVFPLEQYLSELTLKPKLFPPSTACWRGYYGTWEIKDDKLFLTDLLFFTEGDKQAGIEFIFPGQKEVFAWWFKGVIRIQVGRIPENILFRYNFIDENDLLLEFEKGILLSSR